MGEVKNLPEVRFKGFSETWVEKYIHEIANRYDNLRIPISASNRVPGSTPYYGANGIQGYIDGYTHDGEFILLAEDGANDLKNYPVIHVNGKVWVNNHAHVLQGIEGKLNNLFLKSTFSKVNFGPFLVGGGRAKLNAEVMMGINLNIPQSTAEQTQIGTFFKNLDNQITLKQRKLDKLVTLKKAMLEKMFPKEGADEPEIRFKGFSGTWNSELLDANADFAKGQGYSKSDLVEAGTPIVLYGRLYTKYESFISKVDTFVNAKPGSLFSKGCEVVVPASGETAEDIARASAILKEGVLLGGDLNIIYPNEKFTSVFLALSLSNGKVQKDLSKRAQGKSVVHVRNSDIKELEISFPSIEEQKAIGAYFAKLDDLISLQKTELTKLKQIKSSCLEKMFV